MKSIKKILATLAVLLTIAVPAAAQNFQKIGATDCGVLYIDTDSVSTVKKAGVYYLAVMGEEKYTDAEFLQVLRQGENLEKAASVLQLYLFNNKGTEYQICARYVLDSEGKVCADLGAENVLHKVDGDKTMTSAYTKALKALENKKRFSFSR